MIPNHRGTGREAANPADPFRLIVHAFAQGSATPS